MATERFNRQFIILDFTDLDNPEFMEFVRSSEFSTYLIMRRYIWRSDKPHKFGLHENYAQGLLACYISREKLAVALGGVALRTVTRDIDSLLRRGIIQSKLTGRGNVFVLGKWALDTDSGAYYEYFFLDKLHVRLEEDEDEIEEAVSDTLDATGQKRPHRVDRNGQSEWTKMSHNNIEGNREQNRELDLSNSKVPVNLEEPESANDHNTSKRVMSAFVETVIKTCSVDFRDTNHLTSNITHAYNLWVKTDLDEEEFVEAIQKARKITKERVSLSGVHNRGKKMAYFFSVLEDVLGLKANG